MLLIDSKHRIDLSGFREQELSYICPECKTEMDARQIIGFGEYPQGGERALMKPDNNIGVGFKCPKCDTKSCFHADKFVYQMYVDYQRLSSY